MLLKYSGLISILITWLLIVFPAIIKGVDKKKETISHATKDNRFLFIINSGLIVGSCFQFIFLIHLILKFEFGLLTTFVVIFFSGIIATLLTAVFPYFKKRKFHDRFVKYYFTVIPFSLFLFALAVYKNHQVVSLISAGLSITYFLLTIILLVKNKKCGAAIEMLAFLILSIWTVVVTFM